MMLRGLWKMYLDRNQDILERAAWRHSVRSRFLSPFSLGESSARGAKLTPPPIGPAVYSVAYRFSVDADAISRVLFHGHDLISIYRDGRHSSSEFRARPLRPARTILTAQRDRQAELFTAATCLDGLAGKTLYPAGVHVPWFSIAIAACSAPGGILVNRFLSSRALFQERRFDASRLPAPSFQVPRLMGVSGVL